MKITAKLKYLRISPRKVRLVVNLIKGMDVIKAKLQLQLQSRRAAKPLLKLLNSAVASAKHNFDLEEKNLYISKIVTNEGPTLKRWRARARGSASPIMKRTSHVVLELEGRMAATTKVRKRATVKERKIVKTGRVKKKPQKKEFLPKERLTQIGKKIFRRKSI